MKHGEKILSSHVSMHVDVPEILHPSFGRVVCNSPQHSPALVLLRAARLPPRFPRLDIPLGPQGTDVGRYSVESMH